MGGGKGKNSSPVSAPQMGQNPWEPQLAEIANSMWSQTQAPRTYIGQDWEKFFNPAEGRQYDPSNLPAFSPLYNLSRTGLEDQYSVSKENILSSLPRGGGQQRAIGNLEMGRAKDVGSLQSAISAPIISDLYNKAYNAGFVTGPTQAMGGLGAAGSLNNQRSIAQGQLDMSAIAATMQNEAANRQSSSAKGSGVGSMLGKGLGSIMGPVGTAIGGSLGGLAGGGISSLGKGGGGGSSLMNWAGTTMAGGAGG